jgi:thiamine-phosphate pyrophosphorylase
MKGLYLVTPDWDDTDRLIDITEQALDAGAAIVQYRHKTASEALRSEQGSALLALCRRRAVPFIINDHLSLCEQLDADGLHVGGMDRPVADMRTRLGADKIVGASCYGDLQLARDAANAGAMWPSADFIRLVSKSTTSPRLPILCLVPNANSVCQFASLAA